MRPSMQACCDKSLPILKTPHRASQRRCVASLKVGRGASSRFCRDPSLPMMDPRYPVVGSRELHSHLA